MPDTCGKPVRPLAHLYLRLLPLGVLLIGFSITFHIWNEARHFAIEELRTLFELKTREISTRVRDRMKTQEQVLLSVAGLFHASKDMDRGEFREFVAALQLGDNYPGIQGVGFSRVVHPSDKEKHIAGIRREGFRDYRIKPEGERDLYTSIIYLEPFNWRNQRAFGYDMYSEPTRRVAMARARDTGETAISGKVTLVQETKEKVQPGFLMYVPVYRNGARLESVEDRQANIVGWAYSPFRMYDLMDGILGNTASDLDLEIYDGVSAEEQHLLYDSSGASPNTLTNSPLSYEETFAINGQSWLVKIRPLPSFLSSANRQKASVLMGSGVVITLLLSLLTWFLLTGKARAEAAARKMNADLSESEARFRTMANSAPVMIWLSGADGNYFWFNQTWLDFRGCRLEDEIGKGVEKILHPDDISRFLEVYASHFDRQEPFMSEYRLLRHDGRYRWVRDNGVPRYDSDGAFLGYIGSCIDITDSREAMAKLADQSGRLQSILETASDGIHILDTDGSLVQFSASFARMLGYAPEEMLGKRAKDWDVWYSEDEIPARILRLIHNPETFETRHRRKDGSSFDVEINAKGIVLDGRRYLYASARDVTIRKQAEEALQRAKEFAEQSAKAKAAFLANMSHEIRTPMNGVIGLTQLALNLPTSPELRDYLQKIHASSLSLLSILNDILDFSKLESGHMVIDHAPFSLSGVLGNLRNLFEVNARSKGLEFLIDMQDGTPTSLVGDGLRLQQILSNLLGNAIKFTETGGVVLKIEVKRQEESAVTLEFAVVDSGIGIKAADLDRLFKPFSQVDDSISRRYGGSGLGLAISQSLLELMGGCFEVESEPGKGSRFSFSLSFSIASQDQVHQGAASTRDGAGSLKEELRRRAIALRGARVLVAEDNTINQLVVKQFLKLSGLDTTIAGNGREALDLLARGTFDAVLMDIHMPVMDGLEAVRQIRSDPRYQALPVIALTAGVLKSEQDACIAAGMNDFVAKPVTPDNLIDKLSKWISPQGKAVEAPVAEDKQAPEEAIGLHLQGFDLTRLTDLLGDNRAEIFDLLNLFATDLKARQQEMATLTASGDLPELQRLIHTIKGSAGNMGATPLHAEAAHFEALARAGQWNAQLLEEFDDAINAVIAQIAGASANSSKEPLPCTGDAASLLRELLELLAQQEFVPESLLDSIHGSLHPSRHNDFSEVRQNIKQLQYSRAKTLLQALIGEVQFQESTP